MREMIEKDEKELASLIGLHQRWAHVMSASVFG